MIRRGFWLTAGAVAGIYGYRRASALGRRLAAAVDPGTRPAAAPGPGGRPAARLTPAAARHVRRGVVALVRQTYRFTRDVREGMDLYRLGRPAPAVPPGGDDAAGRLRAGSGSPGRPAPGGMPRKDEAPDSSGHALPFQQQTTTRNPRMATDGVG